MAAPTDDLISCYQFYDASNLGLDSVPASANDLTNNNAIPQAAGKVGAPQGFPAKGALFATANSQYFSRASNASLQVSSSFSILAWLKFTSLQSGSRGIVTKGDQGISFEYLLTYTLAYGFYFIVRNSANTTDHIVLNSIGNAVVGPWYFVAAVYDVAGPTVASYVNAANFTSAAGPATPRSSTNPFHIGAWSAPDRFIDATIGQVCFFKRALSAADVTWFFNSGDGRTHSDMLSASTKLSYRDSPEYQPSQGRVY